MHPDGVKYFGDFTEGSMNGPGEVLFPSGDLLKGTFTEGKLNGLATYYYPNGDREIHEYEDDNVIHSRLE